MPATLVHLDTASAVLAAYADRYNASQERYRVITRYVADPAELLARGGGDADVLIGPWLASAELRERLQPLDRLLRSDRLNAAAFFPSLLRAGQVNGAQMALPLSFSLPAVVVRAADAAEHPFAVTPEELAARNAGSPGWDAELVYHAAVLYGAELRLLPDGDIGLDQEAVDRVVELARRLAAAAAGDGRSDERVDELQRTRPPHRLLLDGGIDFFLSDPQGFQEIPEELWSSFAIRWLGSGGSLQPADDLTYAAIRAGARNPRGARSFLLWLFEPATQTALLDLNRREQLAAFGIAGGLPALVEVTTREVAARYPFMLGRAPKAADLSAPAALSADWGRLQREVVLPWLRSALRGAEQPPLAVVINAERRQQRLTATTSDGPTVGAGLR